MESDWRLRLSLQKAKERAKKDKHHIATLEAERDELHQKVEDAEWVFFDSSKAWKKSTSRVVFWDDIRTTRENSS